jgi:hypothetical protein
VLVGAAFVGERSLHLANGISVSVNSQ